MPVITNSGQKILCTRIAPDTLLWKVETSTPVVRTGVYPHMPIAVTANVYNTGRHRVSSSMFLTRSAMVGQVCHTGLTSVKRVINFSIFDLGGLPPFSRSPKGEMTYYPTRSTILQNFNLIAQTCSRYALPNFFNLWRWFLTPQGHPRSNLTVSVESP